MRKVSDLGFGEEPIIGQVYLVPCMDISKLDFPGLFPFHPIRTARFRLTHVPVIGHPHEDPEFPGAGGEKRHIHIDVRFANRKLLDAWDIPEHSFKSSMPYNPIVPNAGDAPYPQTHLHPLFCRRQTPNHAGTVLSGDHYTLFEDKMEGHLSS